ncbi:helicase-related protein [Streptomyces sp. NPDC006259]|uniref:helicase-related protein n=1 Tax=Streptomyces sp. NPDC006259 TaxID=3364740 RepID=UPI0036941CCD
MDLVPALEEPLKKVLGPPTAKVMAEHLGLHTVGDLLHHYPRRYEERGQLTHLADLPMDEHVTVVAQVADARLHTFASSKAPRGKGQRLEVTITDGSGRLQLVFFGNGVHKPHKDLLPGTRAMFSGKVSLFNRRLQLAHPAYELLRGDTDETVETWAGALIPIYPATAKLESWKIGKAIQTVLPSALEAVDPLPDSLREGRGLLSLPEALLKIHRPHTKADVDGARARLKWDEAFVLQVALARRRHADAQLPAVPREASPDGLLSAFDDRLPFTLTEGQRKVSKEIFDDLATDHPMHRLLQGEVGSGKAQPLDSLVLTPAGFRRMGDMEVGDEVVVPDGGTAVVDGVFPQGERDVWRLVLSDGSSVECDDEHLWIVGTGGGEHGGQAPKVMTARDIRLDTREPDGSPKWYIPAATPVDLGDDSPLSLDPYLLGTLLGAGPWEGSFRHDLALSPTGSGTSDAVTAAVAPERRPAPATGSERDRAIPPTRRAAGVRNPVIGTLRELNLWDVAPDARFVPDEFRNTSVKNRLALLQGLMDTDGTVDADGAGVSLRTASPRLADDVAWIVRSLGGLARVLPDRAAFTVSVSLPERYPPFRPTRTADRAGPHPKDDTFRRGIRAVEYVGRKPVQCISVAHPGRAYVTDNFTVTHNTMVALRAMLAVVDAGGQAAMLAPTEVLAQQHHRSVVEMMGELAEGGTLGGVENATKVVLLTGSMGAAGRRQALLDLVTGEAGIVIGTHALIEDKVQFHDLGLVVVDEQHRFGVEQRDALRGKGKQPPHLLVMTATPIPRTVAMTVFGDLETSVLDQLPAGRSPIASHVVPAADKPHFLARAWERVREEVEGGHQAYVVCPRIGDEEDGPGKARKKVPQDEAEKRPPLAVLEVADQLAKGPLQGLRVEVLHGRMPADDKDAVMRRFAAGDTDVLVATTVIEVGVNVPNATAMVIMDADRFGVSQLHQLRGRVGRGSAPGLCLLVTEMPEASPARQRLGAVATTLDGFELSRIDLEQRREGDVLGQAQSGARSSLRVLAVIEDEEVIAEAREEATRVVASDPELTAYPGLRTALDALLDEEREQYLEKG